MEKSLFSLNLSLKQLLKWINFLKSMIIPILFIQLSIKI